MMVGLVTGLMVSMVSAAALTQGANPCERSSIEAHYGTWGVDTSGQDRSVRPGDNFAMYAWGEWYRQAEIPPGAPAVWNRMDMVRRNQIMLRCAIELSARSPTTENRRLIARLYDSYMNTDRLERVGGAPLMRDIASIRRLSTRSDVARHMGHAAHSFGLAFFRPAVAPRVDEPNQSGLRIFQSGLGAGPREFYLEPRNEEGRRAYHEHAARMLRLIGWAEPETAASQIVDLEKRIAEASWSQTESDDVSAMLNFVDLARLPAIAPGFDWSAYLEGAGIENVDSLVLVQNSAIQRIAAIFGETPLPTLRAWMAFHTADRAAPYLSSEYRQAHFEFWGRRQDLQEPRPRGEAAIDIVSQALVHPVSREYMDLYFSPETRAAIEAMVANIKAGFRQRLVGAEWMEPETRREALAKLDALHVGIEHPDTWRDFSNVALDADDLYGNMQTISRHNWAWTLDKLNRPVDLREWILEPFTLGAMANYTRNLLTFPAGYLQPPVFDPTADPAVNYGAIGATIGHEIAHFFDAGGARYDSTGRIRNWWTPADAAEFQERVDRMVARLNTYREEGGEPVNGTAALREQMSHLIGLEAALAGYHVSLGGRQAPVIDGYTGDQRFFLSYAQLWQGKARDWFRREQYEHPPLIVIINDVVRNMDSWYSAFDVRPGDDLHLEPEERIRIW